MLNSNPQQAQALKKFSQQEEKRINMSLTVMTRTKLNTPNQNDLNTQLKMSLIIPKLKIACTQRGEDN